MYTFEKLLYSSKISCIIHNAMYLLLQFLYVYHKPYISKQIYPPTPLIKTITLLYMTQSQRIIKSIHKYATKHTGSNHLRIYTSPHNQIHSLRPAETR